MSLKTSSPVREATAQVRNALILVAIFSAFVNVLMLTGPMFMMQLYDRVLASGSVETLKGLFLIVLFLYAFMAVYDFFRTRLLSRAAYRLDAVIGSAGFRYWVRTGLSSSSKPARPVHDLSIVRGYVASSGMAALFDLPWIPLYLAVVFAIHPYLGFLAFGGAAVVTVLALANQALTRKPLGEAMAMDSAESMFVEQGRRTAEAILPLGMLSALEARWRKMHDAGLANSQIGGDRSEGFTAASKSFRLLLQSALLALGGYLALGQEISAGMIVAASIIAGRALAPVDQVIGQWRNLVRARVAWRRLKAALDAEAPVERKVDLPEPVGRLTLNAVTKFAPDAAADAKPIVDKIAFSLDPGDGLGVIGPSASGKTTLARLIVGAWLPDAGDVRLDGATIDQWPHEMLGQLVGYLPQSLELLSGTIRDNIARFDPSAEDGDIIAAAKLAGVHEMILKLPKGYATEVGYGSSSLSGGQVQRVGLARAAFRKPKFIVLDEPNSNLDAAGDDALANAVRDLRQAGSTVIVMAHRPSALAAVNKALVLRDGRVVEFGVKDDILRKVTRSARKAEEAPRERVG